MRHIISVILEDEAGALSRVAGLFTQRGFNIESLTVAQTNDPTLSRMTIVSSGSERVLEQIVKQLNKLIEVVKVSDLTSQDHVERELMLECVNRAALVSDEKVTLRVKPNEMEIFGQSTLGDASESMSIEYSGPDSVVSFNPKFLLDPLKSIASDKVIFEFRDDMSPGVFKVNETEGNKLSFLCVVMPIRTD